MGSGASAARQNRGEMRTLTAWLAWQGVLLQARPQKQSAKIIFSTDDVQTLGHGDCDHDKGMLYWLEDGQCYDIGERGPCNFGEVLWFLKKPTCISENEVPDKKTTNQVCNDDGLIYWPENGLCYSLLTQGPCPEAHWLQLDNSTSATATCAPQPCEDVELEVFWPEICKCISANSTDKEDMVQRMCVDLVVSWRGVLLEREFVSALTISMQMIREVALRLDQWVLAKMVPFGAL